MKIEKYESLDVRKEQRYSYLLPIFFCLFKITPAVFLQNWTQPPDLWTLLSSQQRHNGIFIYYAIFSGIFNKANGFIVKLYGIV